MSGSEATIHIPAWVNRLPGLLGRAAQRAMGQTADAVLKEAQKNVQKGGPRFLRVQTGELLGSLDYELKPSTGGGSDFSLRAARHGWIHQYHPRHPRPWASEAVATGIKQLPRFLKEAVAGEVRR